MLYLQENSDVEETKLNAFKDYVSQQDKADDENDKNERKQKKRTIYTEETDSEDENPKCTKTS
jgi:hypothetical protein